MLDGEQAPPSKPWRDAPDYKPCARCGVKRPPKALTAGVCSDDVDWCKAHMPAPPAASPPRRRRR